MNGKSALRRRPAVRINSWITCLTRWVCWVTTWGAVGVVWIALETTGGVVEIHRIASRVRVPVPALWITWSATRLVAIRRHEPGELVRVVALVGIIERGGGVAGVGRDLICLVCGGLRPARHPVHRLERIALKCGPTRAL
jgi:hypothetical protein